MDYESPQEVFDELVALTPNYAGLDYDNLGAAGKLWPNPDPEHSDGTVVLFDDSFATDDGRAHLVPAEWLPARELPDAEYPFVLNTGPAARALAHRHDDPALVRARRDPAGGVFLARTTPTAPGHRRRRLRARELAPRLDRAAAQVSHRETPGTCFIPFHFREAAANVLTIDEIDPFGKIPEFKFCAVRVESTRAPIDMPSPSRRAGSRLMARQRPRPGAEARAGRFPGPRLIPPLTAIQREHGWLPREELVALAREWRRPLYEIEGLITFYPHFRTDAAAGACGWTLPRPLVLAARREARRAAGARRVHEVSCLGRCDLAPAAAVDEQPVPVAPSATGRRPERPVRAARDERYRVLRRALAGDPVAVTEESGLRGMGGAGFPTGSKWRPSRGQNARPKYAICNADESEPGTFKDRQILAEQPHLVLEGMLLGMLVCGAEQGWVFIRHEYGPEEAVIREEIERARAAGLLERLDGRLHLPRRLHPRRGVGADRVHGGPPRRAAQQAAVPGGYGLYGMPTLMNSVETLADVPIILERGAEWWREQGVNGGTGLKFFSVSGHVERPGVFCVPTGPRWAR